MVIPEAIERSTVADVPPNATMLPVPRVPTPLLMNRPVPITVEFTPAAPIVRTTAVKSNSHGELVVTPGVVCATGLAPMVMPAPTVSPQRGVITNVPVAAQDMIPPALTWYILPGRPSFAAIGLKLAAAHSAVSDVAVTAVRLAIGGSTRTSLKYCLDTGYSPLELVGADVVGAAARAREPVSILDH